MQAHDDDGDAGDDGELVRIEAQHRADHARARAERDEHGGETGNEQAGGKHRLAFDLSLRLRLGQPLERRAGEIDEIGRHQRQDAGREKAHEARKERGEDGDVSSHTRDQQSVVRDQSSAVILITDRLMY